MKTKKKFRRQRGQEAEGLNWLVWFCRPKSKNAAPGAMGGFKDYYVGAVGGWVVVVVVLVLV